MTTMLESSPAAPSDAPAAAEAASPPSLTATARGASTKTPTDAMTAATVTAPAVDAPDPVARGFGRAILLGAVVGIVVWTAVISLVVKVQWPTLETPAVLGIGLWTGIWGGMFLGGTITVGLWSHKNFH